MFVMLWEDQLVCWGDDAGESWSGLNQGRGLGGGEILAFETTLWVHVSVEAMGPGGPDPFDYCLPEVVKQSLADLFGLAHMTLCF